ncbi:MAG: hypothetical protein EBU90_22915 [Proteobacteria bacterium]|nr:hypothetical protein [Pseudomonadota bacterium]
MAGQIPSFLTGANLVIRIGDIRVAFAQSLSFQRNVAHTAVMGVGAYDVLALEPTSFAASGSMQILRWTDDMLEKRKNDKNTLPDNMAETASKPDLIGNSIVSDTAFNPQKLLLSTTFDIEVYEKKADEGQVEGTLLFVLKDCRIQNYNFNFVPGELLVENVSFLCRRIEDRIAKAID